MCVCVCVVCERVSECVRVRACERACVCVCVSEDPEESSHISFKSASEKYNYTNAAVMQSCESCGLGRDVSY